MTGSPGYTGEPVELLTGGKQRAKELEVLEARRRGQNGDMWARYQEKTGGCDQEGVLILGLDLFYSLGSGPACLK